MNEKLNKAIGQTIDDVLKNEFDIKTNSQIARRLTLEMHKTILRQRGDFKKIEEIESDKAKTKAYYNRQDGRYEIDVNPFDDREDGRFEEYFSYERVGRFLKGNTDIPHDFIFAFLLHTGYTYNGLMNKALARAEVSIERSKATSTADDIAYFSSPREVRTSVGSIIMDELELDYLKTFLGAKSAALSIEEIPKEILQGLQEHFEGIDDNIRRQLSTVLESVRFDELKFVGIDYESEIELGGIAGFMNRTVLESNANMLLNSYINKRAIVVKYIEK